MSEAERKEHRKREAERLYKEHFTMEEIAAVFSVSARTISEDLRNFEDASKSKRAKTATNPKGAGRGKSNPATRAKRVAPKPVVEAVLDGTKTQKQAAADIGTSEQVIKTEKAREQGQREMLTQLLDAAAAKNFTDKGKLRIEDAIRIHTHRLDKQFDQRVNEEVRKRIEAADDATRASNKELRLENLRLSQILNDRAVLTKSQFRQMQMLCHPDNSTSPKLRAELSQILIENERRLVNSR